MNILQPSVTVRVPATSANLGPGFDVLGLAFQIYNRFDIRLSHQMGFEGCPIPYQNKNNAVYHAAQTLFQRHAKDPNFEQPLHISFRTEIPEGRGLGSSASCIVGGLVGANLMLGSPYGKDEVLQMAADIEGHADNVASALFGGLTIVTKHHNVPLCKSVSISQALDFYLIIPDFQISTEKAREVLPKKVPLTKAALNIANTALEVLALMEGDSSLLRKAGVDHLYEDQRKSLIPFYDKIREAAFRNGGCHFSISGSGPTMLVIAAKEHFQINDFKKALSNIEMVGAVQQVAVDPRGAIDQIVERV